jgi:hypothetical protein
LRGDKKGGGRGDQLKIKLENATITLKKGDTQSVGVMDATGEGTWGD